MNPQPPAASGSAIPLTSLGVDTVAQFHGADLGADDTALLQALGMTGSCRFKVCKVGDPWIVQVRETRIGLAASVARRILVKPAPAG
jgi:Fe2+ transport system protein FeoA